MASVPGVAASDRGGDLVRPAKGLLEVPTKRDLHVANEHQLEEGMEITRGSLLVTITNVADDGTITVAFPHGDTVTIDGDDVVRMLWDGELETREGKSRELISEIAYTTKGKAILRNILDKLRTYVREYR